MTVGLFLIATDKYIKFIPPLYEDVKKHFLPGHDVTTYLFTDAKTVPAGVVKIPVDHKPWPYGTLMRYHMILDAYEKKTVKSHGSLFYLDADMRIVDTVGDEILGDLVACLHPGFYNGGGAWDDYFLSHCFTSHKKRDHYFAGAVNGGRNYLEMADKIRTLIDADQKNGYTPLWNDESYLNYYLSENKPDVILTPDYCYPDNPPDVKKWGLTKFVPKIKCLYK